MSDPTPANPNRIDPTAAPSSPTGTPKMSPRSVPWVMMIAGGAVIGLELCAHTAPAPWGLACQIAGGVVGTMLGIASPGWRKPQE